MTTARDVIAEELYALGVPDEGLDPPLKAAQQVLAALDAAGWVVVPRGAEAEAFWDWLTLNRGDARDQERWDMLGKLRDDLERAFPQLAGRSAMVGAAVG